MKRVLASLPLILIGLAAGLPGVSAAADDSYTLTIKDHRFEPAQLEVPAGKKLKLLVQNLDPTPEEFESHDLKREKINPGKSQALISIGPLKPGTYKFVGEYHESTAQGRIVAK
ncbi:MAG: cupredoxin domain-containing protein [Betaproteobacteria bacterium]|nr:cupredoxin domain-containing protein [Betaproteobacteria bacterium]